MIEIQGVGKSFGSTRVLEGIDLSIPEGGFFCLLGPSGCGKTTLLRLVAGLEKPDAGRISVGGRDVTALPPHQRDCALVFQNYALWPHLTVGENITYGLEVQKQPRARIAETLRASLKSYQLEGLEARHPHQLSGGQQQRVALARAMAMRPRALLMDEPLSNLDASLRKALRRDLLDFHRREGSTILYVTHDQEEALALSDRIAVLMDGKVLESGAPGELYRRPRRLETALFLGDMNLFRGGRITGGNYALGGAVLAPHPGGPSAALCIRPEHVRIRAASAVPAPAGTAAAPGLAGTLAFSEFLGTHATLGMDTPAGRVLARAGLAEAGAFKVGQALALEFPAEHCLWY